MCDFVTPAPQPAVGARARGQCNPNPLKPVILAIPVRNEVERIGSCLTALAAQTIAPDAVLLLFNNCADGSEIEAKRISRHLPLALETISVQLPAGQANAGNARRLAMHHASELAGHGGAILTTDADAVVPDDWVARNISGLAAGADAVCGRIVVDPIEALAIPANLHNDDLLECELLDLLDEIAFALDPVPHDPRPRHVQASGASLAISTDVFRRVGGVPKVESGEDRALVHTLMLMDARVRHDPAIEVVVSGRLDGRAPGGMADTIRRRMRQQDEYADDLVEPASDAYRRADFRRRLRVAWRSRRQGSFPVDLAADLRLPATRLSAILSNRYFGSAWDQVERESPVLPRRRVKFVDLPRQITVARELLGSDGGDGERKIWQSAQATS
jgi:GT2 family glycosyltransferase